MQQVAQQLGRGIVAQHGEPGDALRHLGHRPLRTADPHPPYLRTLLEVLPGELTGVLSLELVLQRLGVVVVDEDEALAGIEVLVGGEDQLVAAGGRLGSDVELTVGTGHESSPLFVARGLGGWRCQA